MFHLACARHHNRLLAFTLPHIIGLILFLEKVFAYVLMDLEQYLFMSWKCIY